MSLFFQEFGKDLVKNLEKKKNCTSFEYDPVVLAEVSDENVGNDELRCRYVKFTRRRIDERHAAFTTKNLKGITENNFKNPRKSHTSPDYSMMMTFKRFCNSFQLIC